MKNEIPKLMEIHYFWPFVYFSIDSNDNNYSILCWYGSLMTFSLMTPRKFSGDLLILGRLMTDDAKNFRGLTYRHQFDDDEISEIVGSKIENQRFQHSTAPQPMKSQPENWFFGHLASFWDFLILWKNWIFLKKNAVMLYGAFENHCVCENMVLGIFGRCQNGICQMRFAQSDYHMGWFIIMEHCLLERTYQRRRDHRKNGVTKNEKFIKKHTNLTTETHAKLFMVWFFMIVCFFGGWFDVPDAWWVGIGCVWNKTYGFVQNIVLKFECIIIPA